MRSDKMFDAHAIEVMEKCRVKLDMENCHATVANVIKKKLGVAYVPSDDYVGLVAALDAANETIEVQAAMIEKSPSSKAAWEKYKMLINEIDAANEKVEAQSAMLARSGKLSADLANGWEEERRKLTAAQRERDELYTRVNAKDCSQYHTTDAVLEMKAKLELAEASIKLMIEEHVEYGKTKILLEAATRENEQFIELVNALNTATRKLRKQLAEQTELTAKLATELEERTRERDTKGIVGFYEEEYPYYADSWTHELQSPANAAELNSIVNCLKATERALTKIAAFEFAHNEIEDVHERFVARSRDHIQMRLTAREALAALRSKRGSVPSEKNHD